MDFLGLFLILLLVWLFFPVNSTSSNLRDIKDELIGINNTLQELKDTIKNLNNKEKK